MTTCPIRIIGRASNKIVPSAAVQKYPVKCSYRPQSRILTVPGLRGSGGDHWQTLWEQEHPEYRRVSQRDWDRPDVDEWAAAIEREPRSDEAPTILVAHSFGCLATVACSMRFDCRNISGAMLVAPANPARFGLDMQTFNVKLPFPTLLVASGSDPWLDLTNAREMAAMWDSRFINLGDCGHINAESGFGHWPVGERLLAALTDLVDAHVNVAAHISGTPHGASVA